MRSSGDVIALEGYYPPDIVTFCGELDDIVVPEEDPHNVGVNTLTLWCDSWYGAGGAAIANVTFAYLGASDSPPACNSSKAPASGFVAAASDCEVPNATAIANAKCTGQGGCTLRVCKAPGHGCDYVDPCPSLPKKLVVNATCTDSIGHAQSLIDTQGTCMRASMCVHEHVRV